MSSILNILDSLQHAMTSQQYALNVTQRNVANANDASYTKQDVVFTSGVSTDGAVTSDSGAYIQADRDQ